MMRLLFVFTLSLLFLLPLEGMAQQRLSWDQLAQVRLVREDQRFVPQFDAAIQRLDGQRVRIEGFMMPLDAQPQQRHFLLSAHPIANCFFCMSGGPEGMMEILASNAVDFSYEPITLTGRLEVMREDPMGMYYRLHEATLSR